MLGGTFRSIPVEKVAIDKAKVVLQGFRTFISQPFRT